MRVRNEEILIIDEDFSCLAECQKYYLNMFGDLNIAYSAGRIKKNTYRKNYKFIDANFKANREFLSKKSKTQLALGRKQLAVMTNKKVKGIKLPDLIKNSDNKLLKSLDSETKAIEGQIEESK